MRKKLHTLFKPTVILHHTQRVEGGCAEITLHINVQLEGLLLGTV